MNNLIFKLVATNAGWFARNIIKLSILISTATAAFLIGKGVESNLSTAIAAGAGAAFLWIIEPTLSFIARKHSVTDSVQPVLDAIRRGVNVVALLLMCSLLIACQGGKFLGLDKTQWGNVAMETGRELGKSAVPIATRAYTNQRLTSAKQPVNVLPEVTVEPAPADTGWLDTIFSFFAN